MIQAPNDEPWSLPHRLTATATVAPSHDDEASSTESEEDWAADARRWYEERAQGVDVAQLQQYRRKATEAGPQR